MGNQCSCDREKLDEHKENFKEKYHVYSEKAKI